MKSLIATLCTLGVVGMVIGAAVLGATEATITATVTVQNISLSVSDGSIAYGVLPTGYSKSTCDLNDTQTVTNDGNVAEDFNIKGQNSQNWTLGSTPGSEVYVHKFATSSCEYINWDTAPALTTSYQTMATNVAQNATTTLNLRITTPTTTNHYTEQDVSVTVMAAAHQF
jgi:hypothetical protein